MSQNSAFFAIFLIYSALSIIPTQRERSARAETIEMAKLSEYRPQTMTRDEQRDMNRQIFLNLPKTPTTPWGRDKLNPMTPRTVAFTQLNGGQAPERYVGEKNGGVGVSVSEVSAGQGPSRKLPFREHYERTPDGS